MQVDALPAQVQPTDEAEQQDADFGLPAQLERWRERLEKTATLINLDAGRDGRRRRSVGLEPEPAFLHQGHDEIEPPLHRGRQDLHCDRAALARLDRVPEARAQAVEDL